MSPPPRTAATSASRNEAMCPLSPSCKSKLQHPSTLSCLRRVTCLSGQWAKELAHPRREQGFPASLTLRIKNAIKEILPKLNTVQTFKKSTGRLKSKVSWCGGAITGRDGNHRWERCYRNVCWTLRKFVWGNLGASKQVSTWEVLCKCIVESQGAIMRKLSTLLFYLVPACSFPSNFALSAYLIFFQSIWKRP